MEYVIIAILVASLLVLATTMQNKVVKMAEDHDVVKSMLDTKTSQNFVLLEENARILEDLNKANEERVGITKMLEKSREVIQKLNDSLKDTTDAMVSSDKVITELKELLNSDREYIVELEDDIAEMKKKAKSSKKTKTTKKRK